MTCFLVNSQWFLPFNNIIFGEVQVSYKESAAEETVDLTGGETNYLKE